MSTQARRATGTRFVLRFDDRTGGYTSKRVRWWTLRRATQWRSQDDLDRFIAELMATDPDFPEAWREAQEAASRLTERDAT